jgi:alanine-glyoxylate transaminase/serine-glyoxylate transaminase/serine-pyruvate transaminase
VARMQKKSINTPDETRSFDSFKMDLARVDGVTFGRSILQPGWKWSTRMKPVVKTESCQVPHTFYQVSGITHVVTDGGTEMDFGPGDLGIVPPGHDAWVVGDEPAVAIDFTGEGGFARPARPPRPSVSARPSARPRGRVGVRRFGLYVPGASGPGGPTRAPPHRRGVAGAPWNTPLRIPHAGRCVMPGRHFLQIPGPTNVPERVLRAMDRAVIDHRGPELPALVDEIRSGLKQVFRTTRGEIVLFPGSGTGAWEASIVNVLSPGDRVLAFNIGHFSHLYAECARRFGVAVDEVDLPWGSAVPPDLVYDRLSRDVRHTYQAVMVVHNETSTGVTSDLAAIRAAMDRARHPALLLVDVVSSLGSIDVRVDEWRIDVALTGTQKGLMMPPGMAILCVSPRALEESARAASPRYFFDWRPVVEEMRRGYFPYTPATLALFGLREALRMLQEEGLSAVLARHRRLAEGVRRAVSALGLQILCRDPDRYSHSLTAVVTPDGVDADAVIRTASHRLHLSLGTGLGRLKGKVFRIGHLGALNELEVLATVAGVEMACHLAGLRVPLGAGVAACQEWFLAESGAPAASRG